MRNVEIYSISSVTSTNDNLLFTRENFGCHCFCLNLAQRPQLPISKSLVKDSNCGCSMLNNAQVR